MLPCPIVTRIRQYIAASEHNFVVCVVKAKYTEQCNFAPLITIFWSCETLRISVIDWRVHRIPEETMRSWPAKRWGHTGGAWR